jgi:hypothetical protein
MEGCVLNCLDLQHTPVEGFSFLQPYIEKAVAEGLGEATYDDIVQSIVEGKLLVWVILDEKTQEPLAVFATDIVQHARFKALNLRFVAGQNAERWESIVADTCDRLALENGCEVVEATGRLGVEKYAKRHGFRKVYSVFSKTVAKKSS